MRLFLLVLGWSSIIGSFGDGAIGLYALWIIGSGDWADPWLQVGPFLQQHMTYIYWVKDVASHVMPAGVLAWLFGLPALVYFPARIAVSCVIGWWALSAARRMGGGRPPVAPHAPAAA